MMKSTGKMMKSTKIAKMQVVENQGNNKYFFLMKSSKNAKQVKCCQTEK